MWGCILFYCICSKKEKKNRKERKKEKKIVRKRNAKNRVILLFLNSIKGWRKIRVVSGIAYV